MRTVLLTVILCVIGSVSLRAEHTVNSITYNPETGETAITVIPDDDAEIEANAPPGYAQVFIPLETYSQFHSLDEIRYWLAANEVQLGWVPEVPAWGLAPVSAPDTENSHVPDPPSEEIMP